MALYIDRREAGDLENLNPAVLQYIYKKQMQANRRREQLYQAYLAKNAPAKEEKEDISLAIDYPRYIVEVLKGYYLGEPVKYQADPRDDADDLTPGAKIYVKKGEVKRLKSRIEPETDISPILDAYSHETISEIDAHLGRDLGIYGEAYELIYADEEARPKSAVCDPRTCVMLRGNSVDHKKLAFLRIDKREHLDGSSYVAVYVYTAESESLYVTSDLSKFDFVKVEQNPHYFGEVPAVEYSNNVDRLGDYETQMSLINAYNVLMSDRVTDKKRYIDAVLALYGSDLTDEMIKGLQDHGILAGLPIDSKLEYIQKQLEEAGVHILATDLVKEIHKQSMVVDLTDEAFAGNASGVSLKLKLLTMSMLVKNKIRSFEKGLKKRFEIYNTFLTVQGLMKYTDKDEITPVFTLSLPIDEVGIVEIVSKLQGIVDKETLLGLLWFVKDPQKTLEKVEAENAKSQKAYLDVFGQLRADENTAPRKGNEAENEETDEEAGSETS